MYILILLLLTLSCDYHHTFTTTSEYQEETEWNKETGEIITKPIPNVSVKWSAKETL